jgi:hypothetical protein
MPLEFALRPRFDLEQSAPRRKLRKPRISPLALPMLAYWLAIAGATELLLRSAADEPAQSEPSSAPLQRVAEIDPQPSLPTSNAAVGAGSATRSAPAEPSLEPAPDAPQPSAPGRELERPVEPSPPPQPAPAQRVPERPAALPPLAGLAPARPNAVDDSRAKREWRAPAEHESERAAAAESERPVVREAERKEGHMASLPSCESAAASANESMDLRAGPGAPDVSREAFASVLDNGAYLAACAIPARTALVICAAVQDGKAVGVSVTSEPHDANLNACVRRAVAALRFPRSARLDVARTRFAAAH